MLRGPREIQLHQSSFWKRKKEKYWLCPTYPQCFFVSRLSINFSAPRHTEMHSLKTFGGMCYLEIRNSICWNPSRRPQTEGLLEFPCAQYHTSASMARRMSTITHHVSHRDRCRRC